jgi:hypothetical protein
MPLGRFGPFLFSKENNPNPECPIYPSFNYVGDRWHEPRIVIH